MTTAQPVSIHGSSSVTDTTVAKVQELQTGDTGFASQLENKKWNTNLTEQNPNTEFTSHNRYFFNMENVYVSIRGAQVVIF